MYTVYYRELNVHCKGEGKVNKIDSAIFIAEEKKFKNIKIFFIFGFTIRKFSQ
jgi:hypothetical protein